jgi:hypothetical protein
MRDHVHARIRTHVKDASARELFDLTDRAEVPSPLRMSRTVEDEVSRLHALLEHDVPAFVAALGEHVWFERLLLGVLALVQQRPDVVSALRAGLSNQRQEELTLWLGRRLLPLPSPHTLEDFCALATARAQVLDPSFPALDPAGLVETTRFYCGYRTALDTRANGRGWTLDCESRDVGPAECIHEEDWVATAHGAGSPLVIIREQRSDSAFAWEEPAQGR